MRWTSQAVIVGVALGLAACGIGEPSRPSGPTAYKVGQPYRIDGVWYYPAEDYAYDEVGIASWYGPGFHGGSTANGEAYDMDAQTAAHKTLPMPSLVEVINLENGRRITARINDRGPFVPGRIIDLSRRSAELLGIDRQGTARVRVRILAEQSMALKAQALGETVQMVAAAPRTPVARAALPAGGGPGDGGASVRPVPALAPEPVAIAAPGDSPAPVAIDERPAPAAAVHATGIYVQAGSFTEARNAERLRRELARLAPAQVTVADVHGTQYYRVRLGPVASVAEGDRLLANVISTGHGDARIVVD